jgi:hypothetical protein
MAILTKTRRDELVELARGHENKEVREVVDALLADIARLRATVGQVVAVAVLVVAVIVAGVVWQDERQAAAFRRGFEDGYRAYAALAVPAETLKKFGVAGPVKGMVRRQ